MQEAHKYVSVHPTVGADANGKLIKELNHLYYGLHIAGYYRGDIDNVEAVKNYFKAAKEFIDKVK